MLQSLNEFSGISVTPSEKISFPISESQKAPASIDLTDFVMVSLGMNAPRKECAAIISGKYIIKKQHTELFLKNA